MDVFALRDRLVSDYEEFTRSFITVRDERVSEVVDRELAEGLLWPESLIQLNPSFAQGASIDELAAEGLLHDANRAIFRRNKTEGAGGGAGSIPLRLHRHQEDAIRVAETGANYVLTTRVKRVFAPPREQSSEARIGPLGNDQRHRRDD